VRALAHLISVVFHPLLLGTYLFATLFLFFPFMFHPQRPSAALLAIIAATTFLAPAINFLFFRLNGALGDLRLPNRSDRVLPFSLAAILYTLATLLFYWKLPVPNVAALLLVVTALVVAAALSTIFFKISVHCLGAWGMTGILLPLAKADGGSALIVPVAVSMLLAGLVMASRLYLNAHTPREVYAGSLMGITVAMAGMIIVF
jgi:membrane-associated phospholipid phosphatase